LDTAINNTLQFKNTTDKMARGFERKINKKQKQLLVDYYTNWKYDSSVDLRYRFVKVLGYGIDEKKVRWLFMNRYCNKRRMNYDYLKLGIISLLEKNFIPLRVFHSASEWIAPNEVYRNPYSLWIRSSGFIPLENDDSLDISIKTALLVASKLEGQKYFVYSGNKSIHVWWSEFNFMDFLELPESNLYSSARVREKMERRARKILYERLQQQIPYSLDYRSATDPRRIVPIIGTINCYTGRKVTSLIRHQLKNNTAHSIQEMAEMEDWHS